VIQKQERQLLRKFPESLESRIIRFVSDRCLRPAGKKIINIKMTQLAKEINDSRLDVSKALNRMEKMGLVELRRGYIYINKIETAMMQTQELPQ
jgi:Mn-dependent DtxR family transcriptional regulator